MFKRIILIVLGLSLVIGCSSPNDRLGTLQGEFGGEVIYRSLPEKPDVHETFIVNKDNKLYLVIIGEDAALWKKLVTPLDKLRLINSIPQEKSDPVEARVKTITKKDPRNDNILCIDDKSGVLVNGTVYFLGKKSSYDDNLLEPTRCLN